MMIWELLHPNLTHDDLGLLPLMLIESDPRSAREQFDERYRHGGGWDPFVGFTLSGLGELEYPGDPPLRPLARTRLREEEIIVYQHEWVAIIKPDRTFEVCRMD